jgi:ribosomal protein L12E/L44/L45/RPP1/RPP2
MSAKDKVRTTTSIKTEALRRARMVAAIEGRTITDVLSEAADAFTEPLLKRRGINPQLASK